MPAGRRELLRGSQVFNAGLAGILLEKHAVFEKESHGLPGLQVTFLPNFLHPPARVMQISDEFLRELPSFSAVTHRFCAQYPIGENHGGPSQMRSGLRIVRLAAQDPACGSHLRIQTGFIRRIEAGRILRLYGPIHRRLRLTFGLRIGACFGFGAEFGLGFGLCHGFRLRAGLDRGLRRRRGAYRRQSQPDYQKETNQIPGRLHARPEPVLEDMGVIRRATIPCSAFGLRNAAT